MKIKHLLSLFLLIPFLSFGQKTYSYITDRKFSEPEDLQGYNFRPSVKEIKDAGKQNLNPGSYAFGVTQSNLYVEGEGIQGVYSVNNINPTEYGYKLLLMNARDATVQGHLKVIINKNRQAQAVVFLRSQKEKEIIFFLPEVPKDFATKESKYFTDRNELAILHQDSLWGKTIRPFLIMHQTTNTQERLEMKDSCVFKFTEKITIVDKSKKKDKAAVTKDSTAAKIDAKPIDPKNVKITKEHFINIRQIVKFPDGTIEDKSIDYTIKNVSLKEDKAVDYEGDRYLLLLETNKGEISIFLNGNKMVNMIETVDKTFLTRGY